MTREITDPSELRALAPPPIADFQRSRIANAEDDAHEAVRLPAISPEVAADLVLACADTLGEEPPAVEVDALAPHTIAWTPDAGVSIGAAGRLTRPDVIHAVAHHAIDPVFPSHGVEYARTLIELLRAHEPEAEAFVAALAARKVHVDPRDRIKLVRRRAVYVSNKEAGAVCRFVLDGPPEEELVQLVEVADDGLVVRDGGGERTIAMERLRYVSYKFTATGGSRV